MKFDVIEPSGEQAIVDEAGAAPEEELLAGGRVHPRLARASARMRTRLRDDLSTLNASLGVLHEHVQTARLREAPDPSDAVAPRSFRPAAFSRTSDS